MGAATVDTTSWQEASEESVLTDVVTFELPPDLARVLEFAPNLCRCNGPSRHLAERPGPCPYLDNYTVSC